MSTPYLTIRPGHPDFLDLDWERRIEQWDPERLAELPTGVHRHPIVFVPYRDTIYAIKELPIRTARHEFDMLRELQVRGVPTAPPVGLVVRDWMDPTEEGSGAVITEYVEFAFSYRELISGGGFGQRRTQMLDAFAGLLVELHIAGVFWGDCSLSNVLYRYDAEAIEAIMIDGETVEVHEALSAGQRREDIDIMILNVAGGMADIAAEQGADLDDADLDMGEDIAGRYEALWAELTHDIVIEPHERYRIEDRVRRLNQLGFEVGDVELVPERDGNRVRLRIAVGGRNYHTSRLRELTRIEAPEGQAKQILADLRYYEAKQAPETRSRKAVAAIQWRVSVFEPYLDRIQEVIADGADPVQAYCDLLYHRYALSKEAGRDIGTDAAFEDWVAEGRPGYPLAG